MKNFILLTRLISEEVNPSFSIEVKAGLVKEKIRQHCPDVSGVGNDAAPCTPAKAA